MKLKKRLTSSIIAILCLLSMALPVSAEGVSRVTFTNVKNTTPDLYITKQVQNADDRYEMPEDRFSFTLKLDGELASQKVYRVFAENGQEVFNYGLEESTEDKTGKLPYTTTRSGNFTLKGGQTARFEYVGEGVSYEVSEAETKGWTQIQPAQGTSLKGTVAAEGSSAVFTNLYQPVSPTQKTGDLKIVKNISFPDGYELPETPAFTYVLKIGGKPYGNQAFTVTDNQTGENLDTGTTDENGRFSFPGNCTAVFEQIQVNQDYEIQEEPADGWRVAGDAVEKGAVQAPSTSVYYTNVQASFLVSKSLTEGTSEEPFTFTLLNHENTGWADASYYLYGSDGKRVEAAIQKTDEKGQFRLLAGQSALFIGIPENTLYHVKEEATPGYTQRVPLSQEGYRNMTVSNAVEELTFVNQPENQRGILSVTKQMKSVSGDEPLTEDTFTFRLFKTENGEPQPVTGAMYVISQGTSQSTYETDGEGRFSLKANQTARFQNLSYGEYQVEEMDLPEEYTIENEIQTGNLGEEGLALTFVNKYEAKVLTDLSVLKVSKEEGTPLPGAEFALYTTEDCVDPVATATTGEDGTLIFENIKLGTWYLKETKAPEGYQKPKEAMEITLERENRQSGFKLTVDGTEYGTEGENIWYESTGTDTQTVYLKIENQEIEKKPLLPIVGGKGAGALAVAGSILILSGVVLWMGRNKKHIH